jgi:hypothetical protein
MKIELNVLEYAGFILCAMGLFFGFLDIVLVQAAKIKRLIERRKQEDLNNRLEMFVKDDK